MMAAALAYARHGFPVFPCNPISDKARGSKMPLVAGESEKGKRDGGHWLATTDLIQVERWWRRWPGALIGFPSGARTKTVVIDIDPRTSTLEAMVAALTAWCHGGLSWADPETGEIILPAVAQTQSGGLHFYFRHDGTEIKNRAGLFSGFIKSGEASGDLDHIDVRGDGGYVIAPPSVMDNGNAYSWVQRPAKDAAGGWILPPMPPALRRVVTRERLPRVEAPRHVARRPVSDDGFVARVIDKKIDAVLQLLRGAPDGQRNQWIFWAACRFGEMVRGGYMQSGEAFDLVLSNLPAGVSPGEPKARKTIENGMADISTPPFSIDTLTRRAA